LHQTFRAETSWTEIPAPQHPKPKALVYLLGHPWRETVGQLSWFHRTHSIQSRAGREKELGGHDFESCL